jgi:gliding motility-associated-like protein
MYCERTILSLFSLILSIHAYSLSEQDTCASMAKYLPDGDTVVTYENPILLSNQSLNSNSFAWYVNGSLSGSARDFLFNPTIGVNEIMLVASNGTCSDTARSYVILEGNTGVQYGNFQKKYNPPGEAMEPFCLARDGSHGYLLSGNYYIPSANNFVSRSTSFFHIDEKGCVNWAKTMTPGQEQVIQSIISTSDSGFLISAFPFQSQQDNYPTYLNVFKLDNSGNIVWAHSFSNGTHIINYYTSAYETSDGGFAMEIGSFPLSGNPSAISIIKIDKSGHLIWGRELSAENNANYNIGGIIERGNFLYATGSIYQAAAPFDVLRSFFIKLDENNGQVMWSKNNDPLLAPLTFYDIHNYKDGLVINSFSQKMISDLIFLDYDGNVGRSLLINNPYGSLSGKENILVSPDNDIYFQQLSGTPSQAHKDIIMRLDSNQQISWQFDFSFDDSNFSGWNQLAAGPANGITGIGRGKIQNDFNTLTFLKVDSSGKSCNSGVTNLLLQPDEISLVPMNWSLNSNLSLTVNDFPLTLSDMTIEARLFCPQYLSGCDLLKLQGPSRICHIGDTARYIIHRDPLCEDPVNWSLDSQHITVLSLHESYLDLKFISPGSFVLRIEKNGCNKVVDSIIVTVGESNSQKKLPRDTILCSGYIMKLDAGAGYSDYLWQDGSEERMMDIDHSGTYWVRLTEQSGCVNTDTVNVGSSKLPEAFLPNDTTICSGEILDLSPLQPFKTYKWSTGEYGNSIQVSNAGNYSLQVVDKNGCTGNDSIQVKTKSCPTEIFFPNAFTPNKDGLNDHFKPLIVARPVSYQFTIYNRWGQLIFRTSEPNKGWDGMLGNAEQEPGAYVWKCAYQFSGGKKKVATGTVLLLR